MVTTTIEEETQKKLRTTKSFSGNFPMEAPPHNGRCHYCKNQGKETRTFVKCNTYGVFLCLVASASVQNCFYKHHLQA